MGQIITVSGASGSGKSSIAKKLLKDKNFKLVISTTTRAQRRTDLFGQYQYVSTQAFEQLEKEDRFAWTTLILHGNRYGTQKTYIGEAIKTPGIYLIELAPDTIPTARNYIGEGLKHFYVVSPAAEILRERLTKRGDECASIELRIKECADWDEKARKSGIPYVFLANTGTIDETVREACRYIFSAQ